MDYGSIANSLGGSTTPLTNYGSVAAQSGGTSNPNGGWNLANDPATQIQAKFSSDPTGLGIGNTDFMGDVVKPLAKPFAQVGVSVYNAGKAADDLAHGKSGEQDLIQPRNLPVLGSTEPLPANPTGKDLGAESKAVGTGFDMAGTIEGAKGLPELGANLAEGIKNVAGTSGDLLENLKGLFNKPEFTPTVPEEAPVLSPEESANAQAGNKLNEANKSTSQSQQDLETSKSKVKTSTDKINQSAQEAAQARDSMAEKVKARKTQVGKDFQAAADKLTQTNPEKTLSLSNEQVKNLKGLRESGSFKLPDSLNTKLDSFPDNISAKDYNLSPEGDITPRNSPSVKLNPSETQELLKQLNSKTFTPGPEGFKVNQQSIGIQQELKQGASKAFGGEWDKIYSDYSSKINPFKQIDDIADLNPNANATDKQGDISKILKNTKSPTGKINLQNAINAVNEAHPDLNLGEDISKIQNHGQALDELKTNQKELTNTQKLHEGNTKAAQAANEKFSQTQDKLQVSKQKAAESAQAEAEKQVQAMKGAKAAKYARLLKISKILIGGGAFEAGIEIIKHITGD